jgi:capsular polysaccharide export protein
MGDALYWRDCAGAHAYRGRLQALPEWLERLWQQHGITDQILFGDRRPVHRAALAKAERFGIRTHVFEEGYFRPHWITLEREGVNGHSLLPRDPDWFRAAAAQLPETPVPQSFEMPFYKRAIHDVIYHAAGSLNPLFYPYYRTHAPISAPVEYAGYVWRFARLRRWQSRDLERINTLCEDAEDRPLFLLPLQLNTDAQIRDHSRFNSMQEVIEWVMTSFARHAPDHARLLIKNHPLDMGLVNYPRLIMALADRLQLHGRVEYIETGPLERILKVAAGTVTVNSTVGLLAVQMDCPTLCLSDPVYNLPGLTDQHTLDRFWAQPQAPDDVLCEAFSRVVIHATQLNGGFYCQPGIGMAVRQAVARLTAEHTPLERLMEVCPP